MKLAITYPRPNSIAARYLSRFLLGETLQHREADEVTGSYRLAGYVHYLTRQHGWFFDRAEKKEETLDPVGRKADYTEYCLPKDLIKWAGKEGQDYAELVLGLEAERVAKRVAATTPSAVRNHSQIRRRKPITRRLGLNRGNHATD